MWIFRKRSVWSRAAWGCTLGAFDGGASCKRAAIVPSQPGACLKFGSLKTRSAWLCPPPPTLAPWCVGRWQRPLTGSRTLPRSVLHLYLLSSCSPDGFFCDLTYFLLACAPGLISNAGVYRLCLVSIAAMATGASPRREAKIEPLRFVFPGVSEVLQITHPS